MTEKETKSPVPKVQRLKEMVSYQDGSIVSREIIRKSTGTVTLFAFAMTLLVLGIDVPGNIPKADANQALFQHFIGLIPEFLAYALAFFTLGTFWYAHQRHFRFIKRVDGRLL